MKLNKKILLILISIILIISLICLLNKKNNVLCELNKDSINTKINIELNKNITFTYEYLFDTMDKTIDKYDNVNTYLKRVNNLNGVTSNIEQLEKKVNYSIDIDLTKVKEEDYKTLNIAEIVKLKDKKEIIEYYEKQRFICEII